MKRMMTKLKWDDGEETEVELNSGHQNMVYKQATMTQDSRTALIAGALHGISYAICDLADAIRQHRM